MRAFVLTPRGRVRVFFALAGVLQLGPLASQVGHLNHPLLHGWRMFHAIAVDVCDAQFEVDEGKGFRRLPIVEALRAAQREGKGLEASGLRGGRREVLALASDACRGLPPGAVLRVTARCGDPRVGWRPVLAGEVVPCPRAPR